MSEEDYKITELFGSYQIEVGNNKLFYDVDKDIINIIRNLQQENEELKERLEIGSRNYTKYIQERDDTIKQLQEKVKYLKTKIENKDNWCQLIADIGYDYDGYNDSKNLELLIDELLKYALYARDNYDYEEELEKGNSNE